MKRIRGYRYRAYPNNVEYIFKFQLCKTKFYTLEITHTLV